MTLRNLKLTAVIASVVLVNVVLASSAYASFGLRSVKFSVTEAPASGAEAGAVGLPDLQAGSHPFSLTADIAFNETTNSENKSIPEGAVKDIEIELPPGLVGDPSAVPQCPYETLAAGGLFSSGEGCPASTQIGTLKFATSLSTFTVPLYNIVPPSGVPAQFGINVLAPLTMDVAIRGSDYGMTVNLHNLSDGLPIMGASLTLWGVPADPAHDPYRGKCLSSDGTSSGTCPVGGLLRPFLTLPTSCGRPLTIAATADSWEAPGKMVPKQQGVQQVGEGIESGLLGCDRLNFEPSMKVQTETSAADSPTGVLLDMSIPQNNDATGLAEAYVRDATIALPPGLSINPSVADGLVGCTPAEFGLGTSSLPSCPGSATLGSFEIDTPLLTHPLQGSVYLAQPENTPYGGRMEVYAVAAEDGIVAKLPAVITTDPQTGQATLNLSGIPQFPLSDLKLHLFGGPRATFATPPSCGTFTTTTEMTPYSSPSSGPPAAASSSFVINESCGGGFTPLLEAGATNVAADQGTGFAIRLTRGDGQQYIQALSTTLPPGLLAHFESVSRCGEAEATTGTCQVSSSLGSTLIAAGSGSHPYYLHGQVFLTGSYAGYPFGIAMVMPGLAGPFNLGTVVVRAGISLDPVTGRLTIRTAPLPTIVQGIPLRVKSIELVINRPGFMFNPTNCSPQSITSLTTSTAGAIAASTVPFRVSGCQTLPFKPRMSASTQAKTSIATGSGFQVEVSSSTGDANMKSIDIQMPKQLPSELRTLQKACPEHTFATDPGSCPSNSQVGTGLVSTPIFLKPMNGAVYFVSHGRKAFPSLVIVLHNEWITMQLEGHTSIRGGRLDAVFAVPDVPISGFRLSFPRGSFPAFGANLPASAHESFCSSKLSLPTTIVAQNGLRFKQQTKVRVTGCHKSKVKTATRTVTR